MEFASKTLRHPNFSLPFPSSTIPPSSLPLNPSKTLISLPSSKPFPSIHSSHKSPRSALPKSPNPLSPILAAAATSAALLLFQFRIPPPAVATAIPPPPETSAPESLSDEEKERELSHRLDSHPDDSHSLRELMELKIKSGKPQDAISIVDRLMNLEPGENDLPLLKAHLQSYSGDPESARRGFEDLLSEDPLLVEAYHGLVMVEREVEGELNGVLKRVESALETCKKLKRKQDVRDFKLLVAQIKVIEDKYDEALRIYEELVREEPRDFRPYLCQGIIYTLMRKKDEADKQFEKYRRLVPREHPYSRYFDDNMIAMKVFSQVEENKRKESLKI